MLNKDESKKARKLAIKYLVYRDRSRKEMFCYLSGKGFSVRIVNKALSSLLENNYINDERFAMQFGKSRIENKQIGKKLLKQELRTKGIESQIIKNSLSLLYKEYDEKEIAIACAKKKLLSCSSNSTEKVTARLVRFLQRKGFPSDIVYEIVTLLIQRVSNNDLLPAACSVDKDARKFYSFKTSIDQG
jgi:regulatory protein